MNIVYSTNPDYRSDYADTQAETLPPGRQKLHVSVERHHRGGKTVTLVRGFIGSDDDLQALARHLKNKCGTGGSAKNGEIIIQGENKEKIAQLLLQMGYKAVKS